MKVVAILLSVCLGVIGYRYIPLQIWIDMNQGLLAFLGLLSAAIIQVIPVTTNFLQSDVLTPANARKISVQLRQQQFYWIALLLATMFTFLVIVIGSVLKDRTNWTFWGAQFDVGPSFSALIACSLTFVFFKMGGIVSGVVSLQSLRTSLVIDAANKAANEKAEKLQASGGLPTDFLPSDYGNVVKPPDAQ